MKMAWSALYFGICLQGAALFVSALLGVSPFLNQSMDDSMEPGNIVDNWNWGGGTVVGDVVAGLRFFWNINVPLIESFIIMARNAGCPLILLDPIKMMWRFIWNSFIIEFISGRKIMYD